MLRLAARGCSNKETAEQLVISPKTSGNHIEHIYAKIGASNRAEVSLFAMRNGLLPDEGFSNWGVTRARVHGLGSMPTRERDPS